MLSKIRWPSSPGQGGESRPGSSFWNFWQNTIRPLAFPEDFVGGVWPQPSAMT
jgi:hypothetical protein